MPWVKDFGPWAIQEESRLLHVGTGGAKGRPPV